MSNSEKYRNSKKIKYICILKSKEYKRQNLWQWDYLQVKEN